MPQNNSGSPDRGPATPAPAGLRLDMPSAGDRARALAAYPATAPEPGQRPPLPATGYFAAQPGSPAGADGASDGGSCGSSGRRRGASRWARLGVRGPALRFASRDSVHTIQAEDGEKSARADTPATTTTTTTTTGDAAGGEPPRLRRRSTQARAALSEIGRAFNPAARESESESDTDTSGSRDTEQRMEDLLDTHAANDAANPPTTNIAANNAGIAGSPDFYPVNPSTHNPGVIHVNMSGDSAAKSIVDSVLGAVGSSTGRAGPARVAATPAELEAGVAGGKQPAGHTTSYPGLPTQQYRQQQRPVIPGLGIDMAVPMGLERSPTTLRGVYANLSKLQSRMAEHQKKREQRMREAQLRALLQREEGRREEERRAAKRRREGSAAAGAGAGAGAGTGTGTGTGTGAHEHRWATAAVGARIRELPERLAAKHRGRRSPPRAQSAAASAAPSPEPAEDGAPARRSTASPEALGSFVVRGSRTMPRPESVAAYLNSNSNATPAEMAALREAVSTIPSPAHGAARSAGASPARTPGWDELLASSGMLSGAATPMGPHWSSSGSLDSTMLSFEAERQKILAQLAEIFNRQNFLLVASRALMAFGAPLHRLEANLVAMALNLDVEATFAALPGIILITFGDEDTRSSETYIVRAVSGYDMYRLGRTNRTIRRVLKGRISVGQGVKNLERILATPPLYPWWIVVANYVVVSFVICPLFWNGNWRDAGVSAMLGLLVGALQLLAGRFHNYANLFEVSSAFLVSFIAALLQNQVCFATVSFSGVAMLLPGLALTTSIIEMASRNMITGTVRLVFALCRCFMLGYGISVGSMLGSRVLGIKTSIELIQGQTDSALAAGNCLGAPSKFWWFLLLPLISLAFNISISAHWRQWPFMLVAGCLAYTVSYFASLSDALQPLAPAIAAFAMGLFSNILASFYNHRSAIEPILGGVQLLVPGSLGLKTVLSFITSSGTASGSFLYNIFSTSLSIAVGLFLSGMVIFPNRKKRVGLMTF
ncbi:pheromone-regulated protein prm10 [Coemansia javaensis]|uniref:Pheromone-regulated protein prm10 n=1 Tax=Coemansia javaensis TaxID=2761396 RepID=A0A9W8HHV2_9FUNG|nr:pheromone-regulated protein prm10 [Coemansia javaensis]